MNLRDFFLVLLVCFVWAIHTIISKVVVSGMEMPPLFYAAVRYALVAVFALPWLFPLPRPLARVALVGLLMGGGGFAFFFSGIRYATPSSTAIVSQLGLPMTALLSMMLLKEIPDRKRWIGMALTFAGAVVKADPGVDSIARICRPFITGRNLPMSASAIPAVGLRSQGGHRR